MRIKVADALMALSLWVRFGDSRKYTHKVERQKYGTITLTLTPKEPD